MKYLQRLAIGLGGIVLLVAATTSMLGIADAANAGHKKQSANLSHRVIAHPAEPTSKLVTSFKKPISAKENSKTLKVDDSRQQEEPSVSARHKHHHKKSIVTKLSDATEQKASRVLSQIDSMLSWPKTHR